MQRPVPGVSAAKPDDRPVYLAVLLGFALLLPPQFNIIAGGVTVPPYRIILFASTLFVVTGAIKGRWRPALPDSFILLAVGWIWISLYQTSDFDQFLTASIAYTVDIGLAYFFARATFRTLRDVRLFLLCILPGLAIISLFIAAESVLHRHLLQPFVAEVVGRGGYFPIAERMGLMRARGPFPHAILAGIFMASFLPLYWMSGLRGWPRHLGIVTAFSSIFTVSSAALLALTVSLALLVYDWLSERIANLSWRLFFFVSGIFVFAAELGTQSGSFNLIMRYASLNSYSAYNRVLIWRYGTDNVAKHPWFGIGYADWERPDWMVGSSIDHYWLLLAVQFGVIPPILVALATFASILAVVRRSGSRNRVDAITMRGIAIALSVFALGVISVSIWLSAQIWYYVLMGMAVSVSSPFAAQMRVPRAIPVPAAAGTSSR